MTSQNAGEIEKKNPLYIKDAVGKSLLNHTFTYNLGCQPQKMTHLNIVPLDLSLWIEALLAQHGDALSP